MQGYLIGEVDIMIGTSVFVYLGIMIAFGIIVPVAVAIWWVKTRKEKFSTVLIGALTWFVFAVILEAIPKAFLFNPGTSLGQTVMGNAVLFTLCGCLLAGVFEEVGRYVAFKTVLKKRTNRETGISHGIGHGGFEAAFLLCSMGIQYISYASMINAGTFDALISQVQATGVDASSLTAIPEQLAAMTFVGILFTMFERVYAMILHVGLSILVFNSVKRSKIGLLFLSILLHAIFDAPAALYQFGVLNLYVTEAFGVAFAIGFFVIVYRKMYLDDKIS